MIDLIRIFFGSGVFIPHGHCYLWNPGLVWLHILSDSLIALAYYSIPLTLFYFVRKRQDLPFNWVFLLFAAFITACGTTHILAVWTLWYPVYWLSGAIKAGTAIVSLYTAMMMVSLVPKALALPSPAQLEAVNQKLQREIAEHQQTEALLRQSQVALQEQTRILSSILDSMSDGLVVADENGKFLYFNQTAEHLVGVGATDTSTDEWSKTYGLFLPDRVTPYPVSQLPLTRAIQGEAVEDIEVFCQHSKAGNGVWISCNGRPLKAEDGTLCGGVVVLRNVTERKHIEEQLRQSEARYRAVVEAQTELICRFLPDGTLTFTNSAYCHYFGRTQEELIQHSYLPVVLEEDLARTNGCLNRLSLDNSVTTITSQVIRPHGVCTQQWIVQAICSQQGQIVEFQAVGRDITALKQAEAALQESEERYRSVVTAMAEGIVLHNADGTIQTCNMSAERILGLSLAQMQGQASINSGWQTIDEDGLPFPGEQHPAMVTLQTGDPCSNVIMGIYKLDGSLAWISINTQPLFRSDESHPYAVVASFSDITSSKQAEQALQQINLELTREIVERQQVELSLRESEERFQAFMNHNPALCWITDGNGRLLYVNPTYSQTIKLPDGYVAGESDCTIFPSQAAEQYLQNIRQVAETQQVLEAIEPYMSVNDSVGELLVYKFPIPNGSGQCLVGGVAIDITERNQMEKALQESEERLQLALEASGDGLWDWNVATGELYYSPRYLEMLGYEAGDLAPILSSWEQLVHPQDMPQVQDVLEAHLQDSSIPYKIDYRLQTRLGEWKWINSYGKVIARNEQGSPLRMVGIVRDISDRKQAEAALRQSEAKNRAMLAAIPDLLLRVKRDGTCLDFIQPINPQAGVFIPIDTHLSDVLPPELLRYQLQRMEQALVTGELQIWEHQLMKGDRLCDEEVRLVPCGDDEVLIIVRDISDRKQVEAALQRYERIVSATTDGISLIDRNYIYQVANQAYLSWHNKGYDEIIGHTVHEILDQEVFETIVKPRLDLCLTGETVQYEMWFEHLPIGPRFLSVTYAPYFDQDQTISGIVVSLRDITSLKQAEKQLELQSVIVKNMAEGVCLIKSMDGVIVYTNPKFDRMFGYDPGELMGQHVSIVNYSDANTNAQEVAQSIMGEIISNGEATYEVQNVKKDGTPFWCRATSSIFEHPEHGMVIVAVQQDTTEYKQAEAQIKASLKEKEILLKEIHHRVKNNLQIIYSMLRLQRRSLKDPQASASLLDSQHRIESIALIHEKLYRTGNLASVDFAEYIPGVVSNLLSSYNTQSKNITLETKVDPIFLDIDRAISCGLIINELVSNSLKYAFSKTQIGQIKVEFHTDENSHVTLIVKDDGVGLVKDFDLSQADSLGLQLVQDFVDQLRGTIQIDCSSGTEFRIMFPGSQA